eukprot:PITA_16105
MSGYATTQKILHAGYFWPSLFKDCINAVRKCHNCQNFDRKMCAPPAPLHPIIAISPFAKWGIDFITCNPHSAGGHAYIILAVDYFTKWAEANGLVEAINKVLVTMIQRIIGIHQSNWHNMLFSALWAYRTSVKTSTGFTPFQLVYGLEAVLPIECEIPSLQIAIELLPATSEEEKHLLYLAQLDEN